MASAAVRSRVQRSRVLRLILALLVTVPVVYSAIFMWTIWDPTKTVDDMPVALVNADQAAGEGDSRISAGAEVTANLMHAGALDFHEVDHNEALAGLKSGRYYFIVEIPADFSRTLAAIGSTTAAPALIKVMYNDNNTLKASSIGAAAMNRINAAVLKGVATSTVGTVLAGIDTLGDGLKTAAEGSAQLNAGTGSLSAGVDKLTTAVLTQLAPGVTSATVGAGQVDDGAKQVSTGLTALQGGTDRLGSGATQVADGIEQLASAVDIPTLLAGIDQLRALIPKGVDSSALDRFSGGLDQINAVLAGVHRLEAGSRQVATELTEPTAAYRSGLNKLVTGSTALSAGTSKLSSGMQTLDSGTGKIAAGIQELQIGTHQVDAGVDKLSSGLTEGTRRIPDLGDQAQQDTLAGLLSTPVNSTSQNLAAAQFSGPGGAPTLLIVASFLTVIVVFMCFRGYRYITGTDPPRSVRSVVRRACAVAPISLVAVAIVSVALWTTLTPAPSPASMVQVISIVAAATLMNVALVSVSFTLLGYVGGALTALIAMMLQLFSYGGVWMVETLPTPFRFLHPLVPMSYVRDGLIAAFNGTSGFSAAFGTILIIAVLAGAVNFLVCWVGRFRYLRRIGHDEKQGGQRSPTETT